MSFFGIDQGVSEEIHLPVVKNPDRKELLAWEKELIGLYVSAHPLSPYANYLSRMVSHTSSQLKEVPGKDKVRVAGMVTKFRPHQTKDGKPMGFVTLEDMNGEIELVIFPRAWEKCNKSIRMDEVLFVEGKVDNEGATPKILVDKLECISPDEASPQSEAQDQGIQLKSSPELAATPAKPVVVLPGSASPDREDWNPDFEDPFPPDMEMELSPLDIVNEGLLWQNGEGSTPQANPPLDAAVGQSVADTVAPYPIEEPSPISILPITPGTLTPISAPDGPQDRQRLIVYFRASGNMDRDLRKMKNIQGTLLSFPGKDYFAFQIFEQGKGFLIEFPNYSTKVCPELLDRLGSLMGKDEYLVEKITLQ
jgi:DNA polymerase-3 subunit alpha